MFGRHISHHDAALCYIEDALGGYHTFKDVFEHAKTGKTAKAKSNALRTELVKKQ